jgi:hypothetical protein
MIRLVFKFTITELHLIFALVVAVHAIPILTLKSDKSYYVASSKEEQLKKIEKKRKTGTLTIEEEMAEVKSANKLVRRPFVVTYMGNVKIKRHSELLALLQGKLIQGPARVASSNTGVLVTKGEELLVDASTREHFKITDEQKKNLIKRLIKEKLAGVNICKQKHQLEDEFLMGTLKVNMRIKDRQNLAVPRFDGHGSRNVILSLENCVRAELADFRFPNELVNQEVNFDIKVN